MLKIAVLVSGGGTNLQAIIDYFEGHKITDKRIELVISNRKNAYALERANAHGIKTACIRPRDYASQEVFGAHMIETLESHEIDLVVLAGYLVILPENLVHHYKNRMINIHPSLIPAFSGEGYYGLNVHEAALERGVKVTGATVHLVDEWADHGKILYQKAVEVQEGDTPEILQRRVMEEAEWQLLPQAICAYEEWSMNLDDDDKRSLG